MSDFHIGDTVYVRPVGTISRVTALVTTQAFDTPPSVVGYEVEDLGHILVSDQLELVAAGDIRRRTESYLARRSAD